MKTNRARLKSVMEAMGSLGAEEGKGRTRFAFSEEDRQGRELLVRWMKDAGLEVRIDVLGNIMGLRAGREEGAAPVVMGSHIDTVRYAGQFDGIAGVLSAMEVVRSLNDARILTEKPIAVVSFSDEEGSTPPGLMGSQYYTRHKSAEELLRRPYGGTGEWVEKRLQSIGFLGRDELPLPSSYLELHVEQGPRLDSEGLEIGAVAGIPGVLWWEGSFIGEANHAGSTPMDMRHDSLLAVSRLHVFLQDLTKRLGGVATIGRVHTEPHVINIVPGMTKFSVDLRHLDLSKYEEARREVNAQIAALCAELGLRADVNELEAAKPVIFPPALVEMVREKGEARGYKTVVMPSGAGHDAQMLASVCPSAMIFVPSAGGKSHCPEEWTEWESLSRGADVLLDCLLQLAGRQP